MARHATKSSLRRRTAVALFVGMSFASSCAEKAKDFKVVGQVSDAVVFKNHSTNEIWVEASRGFNAGRCGILAPGVTKTALYAAYRITIPDKGWVVWRFADGTYKAPLRTNEVDVSTLPAGRNEGDLILAFTSERTWKATFAPKAK